MNATNTHPSMQLDASKKKLTIWIVKFPRYLGEQILSCRKKVSVGTVTVERATEAKQAELKIELSKTMLSTGIPKDHHVDIRDKEVGVYAVNTREEEDGGMEVLGWVNKECVVRPVINNEYIKYKRGRSEMLDQSATTTRVIDYFAEVRKGEKYGSLRELDILAKKRKSQLQAKKRERLDSEDVLNMIFRAFEQREQWTVRDLADFTGQPTAYIQELIADICVLNKKDHRNAYELKPEYK